MTEKGKKPMNQAIEKVFRWYSLFSVDPLKLKPLSPNELLITDNIFKTMNDDHGLNINSDQKIDIRQITFSIIFEEILILQEILNDLKYGHKYNNEYLIKFHVIIPCYYHQIECYLDYISTDAS